ncbi:MAG: hypothetical protein GY701_01205 [Sulfitobacter sp.]|nr:hypothetical protein [Sulfitobacter sp.]
MLQTWRPGSVASLFAEEGSAAAIALGPFDDIGRGLQAGKSQQVAFSELDWLIGPDRYLIVEDDLGRRGDPGLGPEVLLIGDRVARAFALQNSDDVAGAVGGLLRGASGYPTNAFVVEDQGLRQAEGDAGPSDLAVSQVRRLATGLVAVIVSAFDAETYLMVSAGDSHQL